MPMTLHRIFTGITGGNTSVPVGSGHWPHRYLSGVAFIISLPWFLARLPSRLIFIMQVFSLQRIWRDYHVNSKKLTNKSASILLPQKKQQDWY